jgi:hypothetical protein
MLSHLANVRVAFGSAAGPAGRGAAQLGPTSASFSVRWPWSTCRRCCRGQQNDWHRTPVTCTRSYTLIHFQEPTLLATLDFELVSRTPAARPRTFGRHHPSPAAINDGAQVLQFRARIDQRRQQQQQQQQPQRQQNPSEVIHNVRELSRIRCSIGCGLPGRWQQQLQVVCWIGGILLVAPVASSTPEQRGRQHWHHRQRLPSLRAHVQPVPHFLPGH